MATQTAVSKQLPKPLTASQLDEILKAHAPGLRVYNPSDEWQYFEVHAIPYWLPPDLGGEEDPHPATAALIRCTGVRTIRSRFLKQKDSSGKVIQGQTADAIVKHIVDPHNGGEMGIVFLPGVSPAEDEGLKKFARGQFLKYQETVDSKVLNARKEFVANWKRNDKKKGEAVPPPSKRETLAIDRSEEREAVKEYRFECDIESCSTGYASNDFFKYARHMKKSHGITVDRSKVEGPVGAVGEVKPLSQDEGAFDATDPDHPVAPEASAGIAAAAADFGQEGAVAPDGDEVPFSDVAPVVGAPAPDVSGHTPSHETTDLFEGDTPPAPSGPGTATEPPAPKATPQRRAKAKKATKRGKRGR